MLVEPRVYCTSIRLRAHDQVKIYFANHCYSYGTSLSSVSLKTCASAHGEVFCTSTVNSRFKHTSTRYNLMTVISIHTSVPSPKTSPVIKMNPL